MFFGFLRRKKKDPGSDERRMEVRYEAEDEFLIEFQEGGAHYLGNSRDISVHGIRFATTGKLKTHDKVVLNFRFPSDFPGEKHFTVPAQVMRVFKPAGTARYRVACHLLHDSEKTKEAIRQFIFWLER